MKKRPSKIFNTGEAELIRAASMAAVNPIGKPTSRLQKLSLDSSVKGVVDHALDQTLDHHCCYSDAVY